MKFSILALGAFAALALGAPAPAENVDHEALMVRELQARQWSCGRCSGGWVTCHGPMGATMYRKC